MKTTLIAVAAFVAVFIGRVWYLIKSPIGGPSRAVGMAVFKDSLVLDPLFWTLALTAAFGSAALYLALVRH